MYNIILKYYDKSEMVETTEELFNLYMKMEHLARIEWEEDDTFTTVCNDVDNKVLEILKTKFDINPEDEIELEYIQPKDGDHTYSIVNVYNNSNYETTDWSREFEDRYNHAKTIPIARKVINSYIDYNPCQIYKEKYNEKIISNIDEDVTYLIERWVNKRMKGDVQLVKTVEEKKPPMSIEELSVMTSYVIDNIEEDLNENQIKYLEGVIIMEFLDWLIYDSWEEEYHNYLLDNAVEIEE
jgi:hypothetical protein